MKSEEINTARASIKHAKKEGKKKGEIDHSILVKDWSKEWHYHMVVRDGWGEWSVMKKRNICIFASSN